MLYNKNVFYFLISPTYIVLEELFSNNILNGISINFLVQIILIYLFYYFVGMVLINIGIRNKVFNNTKKYIIFSILILIDQLSKITISYNLLSKKELVIIQNVLHLIEFKNIYNSYYLSLFNIEINITIIILFKVLIFFGVICLYIYFINYKSFWMGVIFVFWGAGIFCSLIDTWLWGYSYDFIRLPGLYRLDLKDIYFDFGIGGIIIYFRNKRMQKS